jgi:hypothetical protein
MPTREGDRIMKGAAFVFGMLVLLALAAAPGWSADGRVGDVYPLSVCAVSGEPLGSMGDPVVKVYEGREVRFCCAGCIKKFEKDTAAAFQKVDEQIIARQKDSYPLTVCLNTDKELSGAPVEFVAGNRLMKTCCHNCEAKVKGDVPAAIAKLDAAVIEKQGKAYKATKCPVSDHDLGDKPTEAVVAGRLVKLCCADCKKEVEANPSKYLGKLDEAAK